MTVQGAVLVGMTAALTGPLAGAAALLAGVPAVSRAAAQEVESSGADTLHYTVAATGNEVRYRVREQLASISFPSDAVGVTAGVTGGIALLADGTVVPAASGFTIDLTSLATDNSRRDNYVRRNTLNTAEHATAVFVPTAFRNATFPLPENQEVAFQMVGDLTVRGVTRPVVWQVKARRTGATIAGLAETQLTFEQFQLTRPRVGSVLSIENDIRLEYEFRLTR